MNEASLSEAERNYFHKLFLAADQDRDGKISGQEAGFLMKSNVDKILLGEIWKLTDVERKGFLTENQFSLALRLVSKAQARQPLNVETVQVAGELPNFPGYPPDPVAEPRAALGSTSRSSSFVDSGVVSSHDRQNYLNNFKQADADHDGFVTGEEARNLFGKSGLPVPDLAKIWTLADMNKDSKLDAVEFVIAMHLIKSKLAGVAIPESLSPAFISSARGESLSRGSSTVDFSTSPLSSPALQRASTPAVVTPPASPAPLAHQSFFNANWGVPADEQEKYSASFKRAAGAEKSIDGNQARALFLLSKLENNDLAMIWGLSDVDGDSRLSEEEFILAMYLIYQRLKGVPLPVKLPENLIPPSSRKNPAVSAVPAVAGPPVKAKPNYNINLLEETGTPAPKETPVQGNEVSFPALSGFGSGGNFSPSFPASFPTNFAAPTPATAFTTTFPAFPAFPGSTDATPVRSNSNLSDQFAATSLNPAVPPVLPSNNSNPNLMSGLKTASFDGSPSPPTDSFPANSTLEARKVELASQYGNLQQSNATTGLQVENVKRDVEVLQAQVKKLEDLVAAEKSQEIERNSKLKSLREEMETLNQEKISLEQNLAERQDQLRQETELLESLRVQVEAKKAEIANSKGKFAEISQNLQNVRSEKQTVQSELRNLESAPSPVASPAPVHVTSTFPSSFPTVPMKSGSNLGFESPSSSLASSESSTTDAFGSTPFASTFDFNAASASASSPVVSPVASPAPSHVTHVPAASSPFATTFDFGSDFGSSNFGGSDFGASDFGASSFGAPSTVQVESVTPVKPAQPVAFNARDSFDSTSESSNPRAKLDRRDTFADYQAPVNSSENFAEFSSSSPSNSFGRESRDSFSAEGFGSRFDAKDKDAPAASPFEEDPFAISSDLGAAPADFNQDAFGVKSPPQVKAKEETPAHDPFAADFSSTSFGAFGDTKDQGSSGFGSSPFGQSSFDSGADSFG
eukprot:TRINITY_DN21768_c0_g1_i2.p1 TRINITY_DN21768_c0_g1~~TRINITY_DN21768_c0_g1_i2.p1  ORF type:complete len:974 (-),score=344.72 TRINITY_DN21768_c0_g1_i2:188-3109(-)